MAGFCNFAKFHPEKVMESLDLSSLTIKTK